ncbi:MAG: alkaline phosphatase family protein [Verrucomicrobiaceae bacterium]|nr:alkaline phosphatase family protein [Verrucomicrobiaceae bacterium]
MRNFLFVLVASISSLHAVGPAEHVILVSIDGWAHHYFDDPKCYMPAVKELAAKGVRVKRMETSFPTVTWTNHTTLVTGVHPGKHGVLANEYFDRKERKKIPLIPDPIFNKDEIVKTPTIYDAAKAAGMTTAGVIWPASRGATTLDWTVPDVFDQALFEKYSTPKLLEEAKALGIPYEKQMEWCKLGNAGKAQRDYMYAQLATHIIRMKKPNFMALHLVSLDSFEHAHGRQVAEAYWAANDSDHRVADLIRATEGAGIRDKTTFIITTDHGFVTYTKSINANVALKKGGFVKTAALGKALAPDSKVFAMAEGGACFVYVLDETNRDSILAEIGHILAKLEGVSGVVEAKDFSTRLRHLTAAQDPREPDLVLLAADGYTFTDSLADQTEIIPNDPPKGAHGHDHLMPNLDGCCVLSGAGVVQGKVIDAIQNVDITPTMARLLGIGFPNADGRVIEDALAK